MPGYAIIDIAEDAIAAAGATLLFADFAACYALMLLPLLSPHYARFC